MIRPTYKIELELLARGATFVAGCDEVGRGCLAGPVVAAIVVMPATLRRGWKTIVRDSKTLSAKQRKSAEDFIKTHAVSWAIGEVNAPTIDRINIHHASLKAMRLASLPLLSKHGIGEVVLLVDGRFTVPDLVIKQQSVIHGDARCLSIAAASIIAKVYRDELMDKFHAEFPAYGFLNHKGYGTPEHLKAIRIHGLTPLHRVTFCH